MGERMTEYCICIINAQNVVLEATVTTCGSDAEALVVASRLIDEHRGAEVWDCTRMVGRLDPPTVLGAQNAAHQLTDTRGG